MNTVIEDLLHRLERPSSILGVVFAGAFLETTVLPIPFEVLLVPLMLRYRDRVWPIVVAALLGCLAGAFAGYAVGAFAYETFGRALLERLGAGQAMDAFAVRLEESGFWPVFLVGFTPVPVQVATLGAGFASLPILTFTLAMSLSRALRYGGLGLLVHVFGERAQRLLRRHRRTALGIGALLMLVLAYSLLGPERVLPAVP